MITESLRRPQAFATIFNRHFDAVHGYLARRIGTDLADDLAATTFAIAFERRATFRDHLQARPWLFGIATNLLRSHWRTERRALAAVGELGVRADRAAAGSESEPEFDRLGLTELIASLGPDQRDVLLLHAWEGLSYDEIAAALGVPVGTVRSRLSRARARLREGACGRRRPDHERRVRHRTRAPTSSTAPRGDRMTTELDDVRALRPDVAAPSDPARSAAWQRLVAEIEDEPAGLHAHSHSHGEDPRRSRRRRRQDGASVLARLRGPLGVAAVVGVVIVVVGLVVLLGGRDSSRLPAAPPALAAPAAPGTISAGGRALPPGVVRSGLAQTYRSQLAAGESLHTYLDPALQSAGRRALARSISVNHGVAGAFVAMDPRTGAVRAIGSLSRGHDARARKVDLATGYAGAPGMTFAPITVLAALRSGRWLPQERFDDTGSFCTGAGAAQQCRENTGHAAYGVIAVPGALQVEDDLFADNLAARLEDSPVSHPDGGALQSTARALGLAAKSGIDLPGDATGSVPTPRTAQAQGGPSWSIGDNESLAVGQGDVQVSPIQLAVAYGAIANGGTVVQPRVGASLASHGHTTAIAQVPTTQVRIAPAQLASVREGMRRAVTKGVAEEVTGNLPVPVSAQVGTVQYLASGRENDDAWFAGYAPASGRHAPLVVVVWIDRGGFGGVAAAPVARELLSQWFTGRPGPYVAGSSAAG